MGFIRTSNMSLPVPGVGTEPGPQYAFDVNSCFTLIDAHDHSPGHGVQITPNGININTALTFNGNFATNVAGVTFTPQGSPPAINTIYENGLDLYFVDGVGNDVRITQSGGVSGTPGSIANLVPPASAEYVAGKSTFVWQSNTNIAANMDFGSAILRNLSPNSTFRLTLAPPDLLTTNYTLTLPTIPASTSFLTLDYSGNISASPSNFPIPINTPAPGLFYRANALNVPIWQTSSSNVVTITSNYVASPIDDVIFCSGAPIAISLYDAVGNAGRELMIVKTDNSLTNIVTVSGSQTIGAMLFITLNTVNESYRIVSNGTNWQILDHYASTTWATAGATTITATTTSPTKGTATINEDAVYWKRSGSNARVRLVYSQTASGTATNGSGDYLFQTPFTIDTASIVPFTTVVGVDIVLQTTNNIGSSYCGTGPSPQFNIAGGVYVYDTTHVRIGGAITRPTSTAQVSLVSSGIAGLAATNQVIFTAEFEIPVTGWIP